MNRRPAHRTPFFPAFAGLAATSAIALLTACGGSGSDPQTADTTLPTETAQSVGANTMAMTEELASANAALLSTAQVVVASGQATQTITCAGGGTAVFTVTGGSVGSLINGQLDAGENYTLQYDACRGSAGAARLDGLMTLAVTSASSTGTSVNTSTQALTVTLPQRTLTMNGSSTISRAVVSSGSTVVTTDRWVSPQIVFTSLRNARTSSLTVSNVDITRSVTTTSGVPTARSNQGTMTLALNVPGGQWAATIASQGAVSYDANGLPLQGSWQMTLPNNRMGLTIAAGTATLTVDHGPDGTIDRTYTFTASGLAGEAV